MLSNLKTKGSSAVKKGLALAKHDEISSSRTHNPLPLLTHIHIPGPENILGESFSIGFLLSDGPRSTNVRSNSRARFRRLLSRSRSSGFALGLHPFILSPSSLSN